MVESRSVAGKSVALVGLPGAGKSTVGRRLAERLSLPFVDTDEAIEREAGLSVGEIFERLGEAEFRLRERDVLARLAAGPPTVIAAGGGAFAESATRELILSRCVAVWLDADVKTLAQRIGSAQERSLLRGRPLVEALTELQLRRAGAYAQAPLRVGSAGSPDEVAQAIAQALREPAA